ncbi:MAG: phosphocholine cytidylyltransferase family protein [Candidatus Heimdallarchaeaceae archaeon]
MKVIILNSGIGKRLFPHTKNIPKCLIKINGKSILEYQLDLMNKQNLSNFIITTGPFESKIKNLISENYSHLEVQYIHNPRYAKTNYIYSLWLTKDEIDDENILLIHGDLIFDESLLCQLLEKKSGNYVLVNNSIQIPEKDFKAKIENNLVKKISVELKEENAVFLAPFYKFSGEDFMQWLNEIDLFIKENKVSFYAEDVLNNILHKIFLKPIFFYNELCMEIDTLNDLLKVRNKFSQGHGKYDINKKDSK